MAVRYAPYALSPPPKGPGLAPLASEDWIAPDERFAEQLAERRRLLDEVPGIVMAETPGSEPAQHELLGLVAAEGRVPEMPDRAPLAALALMAQDDFCILQPGESGEYVLSAGIVCFPSRWSLAEKIGRPLTAIHAPVPVYDADLAMRVGRIFERIRVETPLWRMNWTVHGSPVLHQPRAAPDDGGLYVRVERQTFRRLPETRAVVFGIRTYVDDVAVLTADQRRALRAGLARYDEAEIAYHGGAVLHERALRRLA